MYVMSLLLSVGLALVSASAQAKCTEGDAPTVSYKSGTLSVTFCASQLLDGDHCSDGCYIGLTARHPTSGLKHVAAVEITRSKLESPVTMSAAIGTGYHGYVVAIWEEQAECKENWCAEQGYVLSSGSEDDWGDSPSWSYPGWGGGPFYQFADFKTSRISVMDAGAGAATVEQALAVLSEPTWLYGDPETKNGGKAVRMRDEVEVLYRCSWDRGRAWGIARALKDNEIGLRWSVRQWAEAPEDFVVAVGKP